MMLKSGNFSNAVQLYDAMNDDELMQKLDEALPQILARLRTSHLDRYTFLRERLQNCDVSTDCVFQRTFNGLYRIQKRSIEWKCAYYSLMEAAKRNPTPNFEAILREIYRETERVEASFASKLNAIVHPNESVYDSIVARNLDLIEEIPHGTAQERLNLFVPFYGNLHGRMQRLVRHHRFPALKHRLQLAFPGYPLLTDIRCLDLILWQYRPWLHVGR